MEIKRYEYHSLLKVFITDKPHNRTVNLGERVPEQFIVNSLQILQEQDKNYNSIIIVHDAPDITSSKNERNQFHEYGYYGNRVFRKDGFKINGHQLEFTEEHNSMNPLPFVKFRDVADIIIVSSITELERNVTDLEEFIFYNIDASSKKEEVIKSLGRDPVNAYLNIHPTFKVDVPYFYAHCSNKMKIF
ncbi:MAG: hypothetical protein ACP5N3_05935 [Candidatus Nanoarchaeia archaeon]